MSATWSLPAHLPAADAATTLVRHLTTVAATGASQTAGPFPGTGPAPTQVLAIDGLTGSGKSTLAAEVSALLCQAHLPIEVLSLDELVPGWENLERGVARARTLLTHLAHDLGTRPDQPASATTPTWDWEAMRPGQPRQVRLAAGSVLILEGSGALAALPDEAPALVTTRVLVVTPQAERRRRIRSRDPYAWDVAAWEAQERQVATSWRDAPGRGPDVVVEQPA